MKNLVALDNHDCALCNYENALAAYFSSSADPYRRGIWLQRWKKVAGNPGAVEFPSSRFSCNAPPSKQWQMLRTDSWVMPVAEYIYFNCHGQDKRFCPAPLENFEVSPCYRSDGYPNPQRPPLCYTGRIRFNNDIKLALIYLHGFVNPLKWHYAVWKHEFRLNRNNQFDSCNEPAEENCRPCSTSIYGRVHESINEQLQNYWQNILSLWEDSSPLTQKKVIIVQKNGYHEVKIGITKPITWVGQRITHYQKLIIKGWFYNNMRNGHLILNCNPVSYYISGIDNINTNEYGAARLIWGELQDVQRK